MGDRFGKLLNILRIELQTVEHDLKSLAALYNERKRENSISEYVFLENTAFLDYEFRCIEHLLSDMKEFRYDRSLDIQQIIPDFLDFVHRRVSEKQYPEAVSFIVRQKIDKILRYLEIIN
jgi:hypothetical protein